MLISDSCTVELRMNGEWWSCVVIQLQHQSIHCKDAWAQVNAS